jgi:RecA-family ATPase
MKADGFHAMDDDAAPVVPLTIVEWLARDLPPPDRLLGAWFTTTSRILLSADTGLGKTNLGMTFAVHMGAGAGFLHWQAYRPARVLYIDGEMSRRVYRDRILDVVRRLGATPSNVLFLSREDVEDFAPLNTPKGAAWLNDLLERIGPIDAIVFDNIMALLGPFCSTRTGP